MTTVLYVPTAHTENGRPSRWLQQRLDEALKYTQEHFGEECIYLPSGRGPDVEKSPVISEAEACKRYLLEKLPGARVIKEDLCVETAGGFAFSKPILDFLNPTKVVIFNSKVNAARIRFFATKIFTGYHCEFVFLDDELSQNPAAQDKEPRALEMFKNLFSEVRDGDDKAIRDILLYKTPFYFKGIIEDKAFFDRYWPGGFENKRLTESSKWGKQ